MPTLFSPLADLYPARVPAQLLVYDPRLSSRQIEMQVGWDKKRLQRQPFWLDENGLGIPAMTFYQPGLYPVRLVTGGTGTLVQSQLMVGPSHPAPLGALIDTCRFYPEEGIVDLGLEVFFHRHRYQGELELELRSPFKTIHVKQAAVVAGHVEATLRYRSEWPLFLVLRGPHTGQQTFLVLPEGNVEEEEEARLVVPEEMMRGEDLSVSISSANDREEGLLLITDARCPSALLGRAAGGQTKPLAQAIQKEIDIRLQTGKLPGAIHRGATHVPVCQVVPLRSFAQTFRLPDLLSVSQWQVRLLVPNGKGFRQIVRSVPVRRPEGISLDIPSHLGPDDEVEGVITYETSGWPASLIVENGSTTREDLPPDTQGEMRVWLKGKSDAHLMARLSSEEKEDEVQEWHNHPPEERLILHTRFAGQGDVFEEGTPWTIYPGPEFLLVQVAKSLVEYPHGCAEQTSSKLGGMAVVWRMAQEGIPVPYQEELETLIRAGTQRMKLFEKKPGLFALWEDGEPEVWITGMVYRNLLPFAGLEIPAPRKLLERTEKALEREGFLAEARQNWIVGIGPNIIRASATYLDMGADEAKRQQALRYVCSTAVLKRGELTWPEHTSWGGREYSTCLALRVLHQARPEELQALVNQKTVFSPLEMAWWKQLLMTMRLYRPQGSPFHRKAKRKRVQEPFWTGLNRLAAEMPEGRFFSTPATREFVELLADMRRDWQRPTIRFLNEPEEDVRVDEPLATEGRPFEVVSDRALLTRVEGAQAPADSGGQIKVRVKAPGRPVPLEETFPVEVAYEPRQQRVTTPILHLRLPPHLHFFEGDLPVVGGVQHLEIPFQEKGQVELHLCGVRRGRGPIDCQVLDMYDGRINGRTREFVEVK